MKRIYSFIIVVFVFSVFTNVATAQWIKLSIPSEVYSITDFAVNDTALFWGFNSGGSANNVGGIYYSNDNGVNWKKIGEKINNIRRIYLYETKIFEVSFFYGVYLSTDNGTSWKYLSVSTNYSSDFVVSNGRNILFVTQGRKLIDSTPYIFTSIDDGLNWTRSNSNMLGNDPIKAIVVVNKYYLAETKKGPYLSLDDGVSWNLVDEGLTNNTINSFYVSGKNVYAATNDGVFYSTNNGVKWIAANIGLEGIKANDVAVSGENIFMATDNGFFVSTNNGNNWSPVNNGMNNTLVKKLAIYGGYVFALTGSNSLWRRSISDITAVEKHSENIPTEFTLSQNYPNPFNPSTVIKYEIKTSEFVTLKVYDVLGREVVTLVNEYQNAGKYRVGFNGGGLSSGIYIYRINAGKELSASKKMLLIK